MPKSNSKNLTEATLVFFILLSLAILTLLQIIGLSNRKYTNQQVIKVKTEKLALAVWLKNQVKGRILLHFSQHLPLQKVSLEQFNSVQDKKITKIASNDNYLFIALRVGLIRKIVAVTPNNYWPSLRIKLQNSKVYQVNKNYAEGWLDTVPITILPASFLP